MEISVGNYRFHGTQLHQPSARTTPLLFLHGFMGCCEDWQAVVQEWKRLPGDLLPAIYALDLPAHGGTRLFEDCPAGYGMAITARAVKQWTQKVQPGPWAIAGYSMGGRLALYIAANFAEHFLVTIAIAASPGLALERDRQARQTLDSQRAHTLEQCAKDGTFGNFLEHWYQMPLFSNLAKHPNFGTMLSRRRRNNPNLLAKSLHYLGLGQQPFLVPALADYPGNLHLVVGDHDSKFIEMNQAITRHCPRAQLALIPNSGHMVPLENPAALARLLSKALVSKP
ncbi:MAG: alpha/beta fold hydrolase [Cyanobacteria bacterium P01_F01_bin.153]